jgi:hypothetical protein
MPPYTAGPALLQSADRLNRSSSSGCIPSFPNFTFNNLAYFSLSNLQIMGGLMNGAHKVFRLHRPPP